MTKIGYARVSTTDQDTSLQVEALRAAGCEVVREEKASGTTTQGRSELATVLDFLREGDTLVVTRIDRLARSIADLQSIVSTIRGKGSNVHNPPPKPHSIFTILINGLEKHKDHKEANVAC